MKIIKWRNAYNTGIEQFDTDHHKIVDLIDTMFAAMRDKSSREVVEKVCADVFFYIDYHFTNEETAMKAASYPDLENHIAEHAGLKTEAERYRTVIMTNFPAGVPEFYRFLRNWLLHHIQVCDKKYIPYLQKNVEDR